MTHTDKFDHPLAVGDEVGLVYGGDEHYARITRLSETLDVPHVELQLLTKMVVPAGSVTFMTKGPQEPPPTVRDPAPTPTAPAAQSAGPKPTTPHRSTSTRRK